MTKFATAEEFRQAARSGRGQSTPLARATSARPRAVAGKARTYRFIFSDGSVDRMGDTIDPSGWDLLDFKSNPVALWAHDSSAPPIGRASNLAIESGKLMGDIEFAGPDVYPFADTICNLVAGGFLNAVSVGFLPVDYEFADDDDRPWGVDFKRQQLLEISVVPVPANPNALGAAMRKGIDVGPLRGLGAPALPPSRAAQVRGWAREGAIDAAGIADRLARAQQRIISTHRRGLVVDTDDSVTWTTDERRKHAQRLINRSRLEAFDTSTTQGRRQASLFRIAVHRADGGPVIDPRVEVAIASWRCNAGRW